MRYRRGGALVPLREFWADLTHGICSKSPPPRDPAVVSRAFDAHFGGLTRHRVASLDVPLTVHCESCRNNQGARRTSVCETHVGTLQGILEATVEAPLSVVYHPEPDGKCTLHVEPARSDDGRALVPWARRADHIALEVNDQGLVVHDTRTGERTQVNAAAWRVLNEATELRSSPSLAEELRIDPQLAVELVKEAHRRAWVEVTFQPMLE